MDRQVFNCCSESLGTNFSAFPARGKQGEGVFSVFAGFVASQSDNVAAARAPQADKQHDYYPLWNNVKDLAIVRWGYMGMDVQSMLE